MDAQVEPIQARSTIIVVNVRQREWLRLGFGKRLLFAARFCAWAFPYRRGTFFRRISRDYLLDQVRMNEDRTHGRRGGVDLMVAMRPGAWEQRPEGDRTRRLCSTTRPSQCRNRSSTKTSP